MTKKHLSKTPEHFKKNPSGREYPEGTRFNRWVLMYPKKKQEDGSVTVEAKVRRWVYYPDGKESYERFPAEAYRQYKDNPKEMQNFVIRMNGFDPAEVKAKRNFEINHAYISTALLTEFFTKLKTDIPTYKRAANQMHNLEHYFLDFYVNKLKIADPVLWHKKQVLWSQALLNLNVDSEEKGIKPEWRIFKDGESRAPKTLKEIVSVANRFMAFLHQKRPDEVPPLEFDPLSRARLRELKAKRELDGSNEREPQMVIDKDWEKIEKGLPPKIRKWILLCYHFGLRRSEAMAVDAKCVFKDHLLIEKQFHSCPKGKPVKFAILKGREKRQIPFWTLTAKQTYQLASEKATPMHPSSFSHEWLDYIETLDLDYTIHDLRHTWITKMVGKLKDVRKVQMAAGHKHITTTEGYLHDDRELSDELFDPAVDNAA